MKPLESSTQSGWRLTLMFREYCSLCHKMRDALKPYQEAYGFELHIVDVDNDPVLEEKYNELVPVLLDGDMEICHWFLDENKLRAYLETKAV
ncbi:glutaredoxin family protein [Neisseria dumasiana]|uniref:Thioredoxin family protein n=1 Tax=Neisseria dumasiana TaxID=1931275 RepID=A0ABX3WLL2_9NEIS|nr:glutaredoxin family protein [Neisseria dumasiana]OSI35234.1 thioredoxin family protein [Neisseria dumasiana]UOO85383.1 glutaredoxin family protein [Neisseria dumasiana]